MILTAALIDDLTLIVSEASAAILRARSDSLAARDKADGSPVTKADEASEAVILAGLRSLMPNIPVISEESIDTNLPASLEGRFLLVDPLDGTRELLAGRDEFTVNIALIADGQPIFGIIAAPTKGLIWRGQSGQGADRLHLEPGEPPARAKAVDRIQTRAWGPRLVATTSRSHLDEETKAFLARLPSGDSLPCGSSIKFCRIAEGAADIYPRFGPTCEWDIAAGHALLAAAGGCVVRTNGQAIQYGQAAAAFRAPAFIAAGDPTRLRELMGFG